MVWLEKYKTFFIGGAAVLIGAFLFITKPKEEPAAGGEIPLLEEPKEFREEAPPNPDEQNGPMYVDVKGAVKRPGIYKVEEGDRIIDAIGLAGGLSEKADEKQLNFAQKLHDEMVVYVPQKGEEIGELPFASHQAGANANQAGALQGSGKVNINNANADELQTLPGIGPAKAQAIIDYRQQQGPFRQVEDLKNVSGIGDKTFEKLKESVTVH
jgi:competence protein ComEA